MLNQYPSQLQTELQAEADAGDKDAQAIISLNKEKRISPKSETKKVLTSETSPITEESKKSKRPTKAERTAKRKENAAKAAEADKAALYNIPAAPPLTTHIPAKKEKTDAEKIAEIEIEFSKHQGALDLLHERLAKVDILIEQNKLTKSQKGLIKEVKEFYDALKKNQAELKEAHGLLEANKVKKSFIKKIGSIQDKIHKIQDILLEQSSLSPISPDSTEIESEVEVAIPTPKSSDSNDTAGGLESSNAVLHREMMALRVAPTTSETKEESKLDLRLKQSDPIRLFEFFDHQPHEDARIQLNQLMELSLRDPIEIGMCIDATSKIIIDLVETLRPLKLMTPEDEIIRNALVHRLGINHPGVEVLETLSTETKATEGTSLHEFSVLFSQFSLIYLEHLADPTNEVALAEVRAHAFYQLMVTKHEEPALHQDLVPAIKVKEGLYQARVKIFAEEKTHLESSKNEISEEQWLEQNVRSLMGKKALEMVNMRGSIIERSKKKDVTPLQKKKSKHRKKPGLFHHAAALAEQHPEGPRVTVASQAPSKKRPIKNVGVSRNNIVISALRHK